MKFVFALCIAIIAVQAVAVLADDPNAETTSMAQNVRGDVEKILKEKYNQFVLVSFKAQKTPLGTNYYLKVRTNDGFLHVKVFKSRKGAVKFVKVIGGKKANDPLNFFD